MSSKKTKYDDLAPIVLPQHPPAKSVGDYLISKKETNFMRFAPEHDPVGRTAGLTEARAYRAYTSAKERLKEALENEVEMRQHMDSQWEKLSQHQLMLREAFVKFNQFVAENEDKRKRASEKLSHDEAALAIKFQEEEELQKELKEMESLCSEVEKMLEKYSIYEKYLLSVADEYDEFKSPMDIIRRFETLTTARDEMSKRQEEDLKQLEASCSEMNVELEDKKIKISGFNNTLSDLRQRYSKAKTESKCWEMVLNRLKENCAKRETEFCRVRESLWSMYLKICKNKGIPTSCKKGDYEGQLVVVMRGLAEIRNIVKLAEERASQDISSEQVQKSSKK